MLPLEFPTGRLLRTPSAPESASAWPPLAQAERYPLRAQLQRECEAMARYALQRGLCGSAALIAQLVTLIEPGESEPGGNTPARRSSTLDVGELAAIHAELAAAVVPATPYGIVSMDIARADLPHRAWLGPHPLLRRLSVLAIIVFLASVVTGLAAWGGPEVVGTESSDGAAISHFLATLFWASAALFGAVFAALLDAQRRVACYDPKDDNVYGLQLLTGLILGTILVASPLQFFLSGLASANIGTALLALLGGFLARPVQRVLLRWGDALERLIAGYDRHLGTQLAQACTQQQAVLVAQLLSLQQTLDAQGTASDAHQRIGELIQTLLMAKPLCTAKERREAVVERPS